MLQFNIFFLLNLQNLYLYECHHSFQFLYGVQPPVHKDYLHDLSSENEGNFPKSCIYKHDCVTHENYETEVIDGNLAYYVSIMLDAFSCLFCPKLCWHYRHKPKYEEHLNSCRWWACLLCEIGLHCILCMGECCFELFSLQVAGMSTIQELLTYTSQY